MSSTNPTSTSSTSDAGGVTAVDNQGDPLPCLHCGYDLRATESNRCPECGHPFDRADLACSAFPFSRAKGHSKIPAYFLTVWRISIGHKSLRHEIHKPQDIRAARLFRRITALLFALGLFLTLSQSFKDIPIPASHREWVNQNSIVPLWVQDIDAPLLAAIAINGLPHAAILVFALALARSPRALMRTPEPDQRDRFDAIAGYSIAPLAWLLPATISAMSTLDVFQATSFWPSRPASLSTILGTTIEVTTLCLFGLSSVLFLTGMFYRLPRTIANARQTGFSGGFFTLFKLIPLWTCTTILYLGLLPWTIGYLGMVIDSFR